MEGGTYNGRMKNLRSALAFILSAALVALSPGAGAWAAVVEVSGLSAAPMSGASSAAGAVHALNGGALNGAVPLAAVSLAPSLSAPSMIAPAAAAPVRFAGSARAAVAVSSAKRGEKTPDSGDKSDGVGAPAREDGPTDPLGNPSRRGDDGPDSVSDGDQRGGDSMPLFSAPGRSTLARVRAALPDFSKMSAADSKGAATADFMSRVGGFFRGAPALSAVPAAASGAERRSLAKSSKKDMPDSAEKTDGAGNPARRDGGLDELGNPSRRGDDAGPDSTADPDEGRGGDSAPLFGVSPSALLAAGAGVSLIQPLLTLPLVMVSLILHEIGHAKAAAKLGDPTATLQGRASFNPAKWIRHVDPVMTVLLPLATYLTSGFIFGGAKPVPVDASYFKHPTRDMAKVAFAGPAVNLALAALGALAFTGAVAGGLGTVVLGALTAFVFINALLAVFNLMPILPLDGGHILLALLPARAAEALRGFYGRIGMLGMVPIVAIAVLGGGAIMAAAAGLTHILIGASFAVTGVQLAGSVLPAMAALGLALGQLKGAPVAKLAASAPPAGPAAPGPAGASARPVDLVVMFSDKAKVTQDLHLSAVDPRAADYVRLYEGTQRGLLAELAFAGLTPDALSSYDATPIASYKRINAATIRVDAARAAEFEAALVAQGHKVFPNDRRKIIIPAPIVPEDADPTVRNAVTMAENLKITGADRVQAVAARRWGAPEMNPWQRFKSALGLAPEAAPQPLVGVVDSGADTTHPLLKRVKEVKNATSGENVDDIGHGSWVTSMVLNYAPWAKNVTHYKTFLNGGATLDDILKALTMAANDGNLVISNSWGSDDGDPESPDSKLVAKLAGEGHIMVFAAGNAGPGKNTVGSPAIVQYKDAQTGAIRVLAVAAADRNKKIAYFSSRGPGSPKTKGSDAFAHRPDLTGVGYNTDGAWPAALGDADRTDPVAGPLKAISGTSMSTPSIAGALVLLAMMFGVTSMGPKLDAVVNAVMATLEKTGKNSVDEEGQGFIDVEAAYELLYKQFNPGQTPPTAILRYRRLKADAESILEYVDPQSEANVLAGPHDPKVVESMLQDYREIAAARKALEAEYPMISHQSAGPVARAWARLTGRVPVAAHVAEYRRLSAAVRREEEELRAYRRTAAEQAAEVREELLQRLEDDIEPRGDADRAALRALLAAHPHVEYEAAGPWGRLWLRLTGRAPKLS